MMGLHVIRVAVVAAVLSAVAAASAAAAGMPVQVIFTGSGTYTIDQSYSASGGTCTTHDNITIAWGVGYSTTIESGLLQGAIGQRHDVESQDFSISGICTYMNTVPPCSTDLSPASAAQPTLSASGTDPTRVFAQSVPGPLAGAFCAPSDNPFMGRDLYFLNQALPDVTTGVADIPQRQLTAGTSVPVGLANAPGHVTRDCTGQGPGASANTSCTASIDWSGHISISCAGAEIGTITLSEGDGPPQGSTVCKGQTIKTGANSRVEITFKDGAIMRLGPNSEVDDLDESFTPGSPSSSDTFKLILGTIWGHVEKLAGHQFVDEGGRATTGVRGSAFTDSATSSSRAFHVIEGTGFVIPLGKSKTNFPAGYTAIVTGNTFTLSTNWRAADQALVPAAERPPALTHIRLSGVAGGPSAKLALTLGTPATIVVKVLKGNRVVTTFIARGRKGTNTLRPLRKKLPAGRYTVLVSATSNKRVSLTTLTARVA